MNINGSTQIEISPVYEKNEQIGWRLIPPEGYLIYIPKTSLEDQDEICSEYYLGMTYDPSVFVCYAIPKE